MKTHPDVSASSCVRFAGRRSPARFLATLSVLSAAFCLGSPRAGAQETVGGGSISNPAVGPAPSYGIGGPNAVLVKNWHFGADGTIRTISDMNAEFYYHDQFGTIDNGGNYGALIVAPDSADALSGQPVEGVACPPVRAFLADSLQTYLQPLNGATTVYPQNHNAGCGSFMAKWNLPAGGSWLGEDIVWETRVRYVTPPYFWFSIWTAGNLWKYGAEHDLMESFGYDNGGGATNYDGRYWHSNTVPMSNDTVDYSDWATGMASVGITSWDPTAYHIWTWYFKGDNTYAMYMDGIKIQSGKGPYSWTLGADPLSQPLDVDFLFDAGWGHTQVASVDHSMPASNFSGTYYEWNYSRVYLVPPTSAPPAPTGLTAMPDQSTTALLRWNLTPYASSYNVYRGTSPGGEGAQPIATGLKSLSCSDSGLTDGVTYYYVVTGTNSVGTSLPSNEASVTPVPTVTVDDADSNCVFVGAWTLSTSAVGYYGSGYHHDGNTGSTGGKTATFTPNLPTSRLYKVYFRAPAGTNRASNVQVTVNYSGGSTNPPLVVNEKINNNLWILLGTYPFDGGSSGDLVIDDTGANGYVIADAVRWVPAAPPAPSGVTATSSDNQVTLNWSASTDATSYLVKRATMSGGPYTVIGTPASPGYFDTTAVNGTTYFYVVSGVNDAGEGDSSAEVSATPPGGSNSTVLLHPIADAYVQDGSYAGANFGSATVLKAKTDVPGSGWNRNAFLLFDLTGVTGTITSAQLSLYGSLSSADSLAVSAYPVVDTTWTDSGITWNNQPAMSTTALSTQTVTNTTGQTATWDVTSYAAGNVGKFLSVGINAARSSAGAVYSANSQDAATNQPQLVLIVSSNGLPAAPTNLAAALGNAKVALTWTAAANATSYNIYRGTTAGGEAATPVATGVTAASYLDTGLANGTTYFYKVAAANGSGASSLSNEASATPAPMVTLFPVADAYVQDGSYAGTNFGPATVLKAKTDVPGSGWNRNSFLLFDLTGVTGTITSAQLSLYGSLSSADSLAVSAYPVVDTTWTDSGITWNNQPAMSTTALSTQTVTNTTGQTATWDVTSWASSSLGNLMGLGMAAAKTSAGAVYTANSVEAGSNEPTLILTLN